MIFSINFYSLLTGLAMLVNLNSPPTKEPKSERKFSIAVLPDTQYYTEESRGGKVDIFDSQINWILANREKENIVYVAHLGDLVNKGEIRGQWDNATRVMYKLKKHFSGFPEGIPYVIAIGNHDQGADRIASNAIPHYNQFFGVDRFKDRSYYGGHFAKDNESHYDLFSAGGIDFIVIYIEYDSLDLMQDGRNDWAVKLQTQYADRKAIIVSHFITINNPVTGTNFEGKAPFGKQGQRLYDRVKTQSNLFMMLCGHVGENGEGYRLDRYAGNAIKTFLSDYQSRPNGGDGWMRLMTFDLDRDLIQVRTISPHLNDEEIDGDSKFEVPLFRDENGSRTYDFLHNGRSSLAFYRDGTWFVGKDSVLQVGQAGYLPIPGNYFGDGRSAPAVFDPVTATAFIPGRDTVQIGKPGDIPFVGDFDGDGVSDVAAWRSKESLWTTKNGVIKFGHRDGIPVPADYDGDGITEAAVWQSKLGRWQIQGIGGVLFGEDGDIPVPADYNGDGRVEIAVYRPSTGEWLVYGSEEVIKLGGIDDLPVPGDYFGRGKAESAVFNRHTKTLTMIDGTKVVFNVEFDIDHTTIVNLPNVLK